MSFGKWYEEKKNDDSETTDTASSGGGGSSWLFNIEDSMQLLPTLHSDSLPNVQNFTLANMKASMEQQMPKKILGLNYQQRFKVSKYIAPSTDAIFTYLCLKSTKMCR